MYAPFAKKRNSKSTGIKKIKRNQMNHNDIKGKSNN
jgi:hypothetical protein